MFLLHVVDIKINPQQYLLSQAYLHQYLNHAETASWANDIKAILDEHFSHLLSQNTDFSYQYLLNARNKALCALPSNSNTLQISLLNPQTNRIDSLFLVKNTPPLWEAPRNLKFSALSLAIQLQCPKPFFELILSNHEFYEQPSHISLHAWFTIQRIKSRVNPEWYKELFEFLTDSFSLYTHYDGSLLHYLIEHKQLPKMIEHKEVLVKYLESCNTLKQTPLMFACAQSQEYVEYLLEMKPNLLHADSQNILAIQYLLQSEHTHLSLNVLKEFPAANEIGLPIYILLHSDLSLIKKIQQDLPDFFTSSEINIENLLRVYISNKSLEHIHFLHQTFNLFKHIEFFNSFLSLAIYRKQWPIANFLLQSDAFNFGESCRIQANKTIAQIMFETPETLQLTARQKLILRFPDLIIYHDENGQPVINKIFDFMKYPTHFVTIKDMVFQMFQVLNTHHELFPNWLGFTERFFDFLNLGIQEKIIRIDDLVGNQQSILYYYDEYINGKNKQHYLREMNLFYSFFSPNINQKNSQQQHMLTILSKLPQAVSRLTQFITAFHTHQLQLTELNPEQDSLLDVCHQLDDQDFSRWCFKTLKAKLTLCLAKTQTIVQFFRQTPQMCVDLLRQTRYGLSEFLSLLNAEQHADIIQFFTPPARCVTPNITELDLSFESDLDSEPDKDDEKQSMDTLSSSSVQSISPHLVITFEWPTLIEYIKKCNTGKIKELKLECYHDQLKELFASNNLYQLFSQVLLEKPQNYTYQFCRIPAVTPYITKILHDCILEDNLKLFSRLTEIKSFQRLFTQNLQDYLILMLKHSNGKSKILDSYLEENTLLSDQLSSPTILIQAAIKYKKWAIFEQCLPMLSCQQKAHILASEYAQLELHGKLDLFEIETKVESKVIRCITPPVTMLQHISMFSTSKKHAVSIHAIPYYLLKMTQAIHEYFRQACFLTGSAVTNLYLGKHHQSDYDCLIFDIELRDIQAFLLEYMQIPSQIIGKKHPILKINFKSLDIEFSKASGSAEQINQLMFQRDFNLAGLYINLNP